MNDLISRKEAIARIHDYEVRTLSRLEKAHLAGMSSALKDIPAVDAVPVVRCRKCHKWGSPSWDGKLGICSRLLDAGSNLTATKATDFCSHGAHMDFDQGKGVPDEQS